MRIENKKMIFDFIVEKSHFRIGLLILPFVIFLIDFGIGKNPREFSENKYLYFYFDYPRKYEPGRDALGFRIKLK